MKRFTLSLIIACSALVASVSAALAQCPHCGGEGCCYQEVVTYRCIQVPDTRPVKKVVYECKWVPFCQPKLPKFLHCDCCPDCECPRFKKVLLKKEIEVGVICGTKCVVEEVIERVPVPCCHCAPLRHAPGAVAPLPPALAPQEEADADLPPAPVSLDLTR